MYSHRIYKRGYARMKEKIFIFIIIFFIIIFGTNIFSPRIFAQNTASTPKNVPRVVLVELFVQEGCPICSTAELCLEDLAWEYGTKKLILVEEHLWDDGYDTLETNALYEELTRPSLLEISAVKTSHPNPLPNIIIEGTVKNSSDTPLKDLAVCGMVGKEGDESGLYNYIQDIFPFQDMPPLLPGTTFNFKFIPEILLTPESEIADKKEILHLVIFVQNTITKEILQALYIE